MCSFRKITNFISKQSGSPFLKLLNVRRLGSRGNEKFVKLPSSETHKQSSQVILTYTQPSTPLNGSLSSLYSGRNHLARRFSTSNTVWSVKKGSNQEKEKFKNYVLFTSVAFIFLGFLFAYNNMQYHQDFVFIEPSEDEKSK